MVNVIVFTLIKQILKLDINMKKSKSMIKRLTTDEQNSNYSVLLFKYYLISFIP
jgi:hypothetical protein